MTMAIPHFELEKDTSIIVSGKDQGSKVLWDFSI